MPFIQEHQPAFRPQDRRGSIGQYPQILLPEDLVPINTLEDYRFRGGLRGLAKARTLQPIDVISEVKRAGLRGRGGAGFPAAVKWEGVYSDPSETKYLVCNGSEGEPGTFKDRYLIRKNPYQLVEGMLIASYAIGAKQAFIGLKEKFKFEVERVRRAIQEFEQADLMPAGYIEIVLGPDEYLFGEEKALLEVIDGRGAMPRILPPYVQGVHFTPTDYNPTVVNNVETMSNIPHILAKSADWFRTFGSKDTPGTMVFTLCGDVKFPGMYELPMGITLRDLLEKIGGGPIGDKPFKAVFSGVANRVITPDQFDTPLDFGSMRAAGSGLGSGGFIVYDESMSMLKVAALFSGFLAEESCGQCVPCKMGCATITRHLNKLQAGKGSDDDLDTIIRECGKVTNQTRCYLPAEESILISSIIEKFPQDFDTRFNQGYLREPVLPKIEDFDEHTGYFRMSR